MNLPATIPLLTLLALPALQASQPGTIETLDGKQITGAISFSKEGISIKAGESDTQTFQLDQFRMATFAEDPNHNPKQPEIIRNGLRGRYYSNIQHEDTPVERIDPVISFDWGEAAPAEKVRPNGFSVRWEGEVECPVGGEITFEVESDDGSRLWVDGKKMIDHWEAQSPTTHSGKVKLEAKRRYPIKVEYYDAWSNAVVRLRWKAEGLPREIIPSKHLFPLPPNNPATEKFLHEVCLKSGSVFAGKITSADSRRVHLETSEGTLVIPKPAVGYLKFAHSWGNDLGVVLDKKPPGVAYLNRDYAEGKFKEFKDGIATMESVLFGKQNIQQAELRAIKLAENKGKPTRFWLLTTSDTRLLVNSVETMPDGQLKIQDASGYHLTIPASMLRQLKHNPWNAKEAK